MSLASRATNLCKRHAKGSPLLMEEEHQQRLLLMIGNSVQKQPGIDVLMVFPYMFFLKQQFGHQHQKQVMSYSFSLVVYVYLNLVSIFISYLILMLTSSQPFTTLEDEHGSKKSPN